MQSLTKKTSAFVLPALLLTAFVLMGQGCPAPSASDENGAMTDSSEGVHVGDVAAFEAPSDWGTNRSETFTFRYPPEYTADLDFTTREIVVTDVETEEVIMLVQYFDSVDPVFVDVAGLDTFAQMVGSAELK